MKSYRLHDLSPDQIRELCSRNPIEDLTLLETCRAIFDAVDARGDEAVREYTLRFDGVQTPVLGVAPEEFSKAGSQVSEDSAQALRRAATNIRTFHQAQRISQEVHEVEAGIRCWRESRPIASVGLYVPGGTAVLPSTVLMLGVPARIAGCSEVTLSVPPRPDGSVAPEVLVAAEIAGISEVLRIGGAQAIAAMCIGTETVSRVDKILGPGSRIVQSAKLLASLRGTAIDMVAGPSEVLVVADETALPEFVASDLIAQAEHGSDSQTVLVSTSESTLTEVGSLLESTTQDLPRRRFAADALEQSFSVLAPSLEDALRFANSYAPEHLILHLEDPRQWVSNIDSAGSVFLGPWSPEVAGDYASGTNHTLPTSGLARSFSGVSLDSYVKKITFQELNEDGLRALAPTLETLAALEGLEGHRRAVAIRLGRGSTDS